MSRSRLRYHAFVLRVWLEPGTCADGRDEWRGRIEHVATGRTAHFRRLESLPATLERLVTSEGPP